MRTGVTKDSCLLLSGVPGVGKTTVMQLVADQLPGARRVRAEECFTPRRTRVFLRLVGGALLW